MDPVHIKHSSGKGLCSAVFCMTVPLLGAYTHRHTHTPHHTHIHSNIWQHGMGRSCPLHKCFVVSDFEQQCNKTPASLLIMLVMSLGQSKAKKKKHFCRDHNAVVFRGSSLSSVASFHILD